MLYLPHWKDIVVVVDDKSILNGLEGRVCYSALEAWRNVKFDCGCVQDFDKQDLFCKGWGDRDIRHRSYVSYVPPKQCDKHRRG